MPYSISLVFAMRSVSSTMMVFEKSLTPVTYRYSIVGSMICLQLAIALLELGPDDLHRVIEDTAAQRLLIDTGIERMACTGFRELQAGGSRSGGWTAAQGSQLTG